jgi:hypothetical protein
MVLPREGVYWGTRQPDTSRLGGSPTGGSTEPRSLMLPPHVWVLTNRSLTTSLCDQSAIGGAEMSGKIVQLRQAKKYRNATSLPWRVITILSSCATSSAPVQTKKRPLVAGPLQEMVGPFYGRLGACDGGGVKPSIVGGAAGALVCGGVALFDATRVGLCPTPLKARARIIAMDTAPAIHPQLVPVRSGGSYPYIGSFETR